VRRNGTDLPFPDDAAWARYVRAGGALARDDWRRANVNALVQDLQRTTRAHRPQARFGVSPFGIGRPGQRPPGIEGFSQYDRLYADVELWLAQGWCDYLAPQLYWPIDRAPQAFARLLAYWVAHNPRGRHIWPGLYTSRVGAAREPWPAAEVVNQVALARMQRGSSGHLHFSMAALMQDRDGIATRLQRGPYAEPAVVPSTPWIDGRPPAAPRVKLQGGRAQVEAGAGPPPFVWAFWQGRAGRWRLSVQPARENTLELAAGSEGLALSAVGRGGGESQRVVLRLG
jgi:uncharacterized lipoprotein YddW (UPF0748 family)